MKICSGIMKIVKMGAAVSSAARSQCVWLPPLLHLLYEVAIDPQLSH